MILTNKYGHKISDFGSLSIVGVKNSKKGRD